MEAGGRHQKTTHQAVLMRHLASFDKLLQYTVSRFSIRRLHDRLGLLQRSLHPQTPGKNRTALRENISSLSHLRAALVSLGKTTSGRPPHTLRYFESFFEDFQFLRELKRYFDERIHRPLYETCYDPADDPYDIDSGQGDLQRSATNGSVSLSGEAGEMKDVGGLTSGDLDFETPGQAISHTVYELYLLSQRWDTVLTEELILTDDWEPESTRALAILKDTDGMEAVLRVMPDVFIKASKSLELARCWTQLAYVVYGPQWAASSVKQVYHKEQLLKERLLSLTLEVAAAEDQLEGEQERLRKLRLRQERHLKLDEDCKRVEDEQERVSRRLDRLKRQTGNTNKDQSCKDGTSANETKDQVKAIRDKGKGLNGNMGQWESGGPRVGSCGQWERRPERLDVEVLRANHDLELLRFQLQLLKEDYSLEVLLLPEIISYITHAEERAKDAERRLVEKQYQRDATQRAIMTIRQNCARMRQIVEKYCKQRQTSSGVSIETNEAGDTLSTSTGRSSGTCSVDLVSDASNEPDAFSLGLETEDGLSIGPSISKVNDPYGNCTPLLVVVSERDDLSTARDSVVSRQSGILKNVNRGTTSRDTQTSAFSPSPSIDSLEEVAPTREGKESHMSERSRTKNVHWKSPPVSDGSDIDD